MKNRTLSPSSIWDETHLYDFMDNNGIKVEHANKIWRFLLRNTTSEIIECPELPKIAYELIPKNFVPFTTKVESINTSDDRTTTKLLVRLQDGGLVETVIMRYDGRGYNQHKGRTTVCISSQVGCAMACTFCATGTMGLSGNLTSGEIIEQLIHANRIEPIRNVVFMGMVILA